MKIPVAYFITGRTPISADDWTAEHNLKIHRHRRFSKETREMIVSRLQAGELAITISRELSIPHSWIRKLKEDLRKQRQLALPQSHPDPKYDHAQELWRDGLTYVEIAKEYNYTFVRMRGVIERYRKMYGLFPKRNRSNS